ncbi:MAG: threonine 3-dehydrogenase, partial [Actinomycetota bacterium]|nr:threonine 3-dehydrogenase [Actinomycetota bacterium]
RRELALKMGATVAIDPAVTRLDEVFGGLAMVEGYDVALEMSGNADALRAAIGAMAHGGGIAVLGLPPHDVPIDLGEVVRKMLTIRGIYGREMYETWYKMTVMLLSGLDVTPAITHRFDFHDHAAAFAAARSGESGKVVMNWAP